MQSQLDLLVARWPKAGRKIDKLERDCKGLIAHHLKVILDEARRLGKQKMPGLSSEVQAACDAELRDCLKWAGSDRGQLMMMCTQAGEAADNVSYEKSMIADLRLGLGSPGYTGCLPVAHSIIRWETFVDGSTGILSAMDRRGLHLMALPGARIPSNTTLPGLADVCILARGGPSYASTAFVWRRSVLKNAVSELKGVGSDRRLPISIRIDDDKIMWIILVYFPPFQSSSREEEWRLELEGLKTDLDTIRSMNNQAEPASVLLLGDINVEPAEMGGRDASTASRRILWTRFLEEHRLMLCNPMVDADAQHKVWLPLRQKYVQVGTGATHHCSGQARGLDIVGCTEDLDVDVMVHNGVHCKTHGQCTWDECVEYTAGDHFLVEANVKSAGISIDLEGSRRMPGWWTDASRWEKGLGEAQFIFDSMDSLLEKLQGACGPTAEGFDVRLKRLHCSWLADASAWLFALLHTLVLWGWVLPAGVARSGNIAIEDAVFIRRDDLKWVKLLQAASLNGELPAHLLSRIYRSLKSAAPQPHHCLTVEGKSLDMPHSHAKWCEQVHSQGVWTGIHDADFEEEINEKIASSLGRAWSHRGQGLDDCDVSESECMRVYGKWWSTNATTPDLITRIVFRTGVVVWHKVVWRLMLLTGPTFFALRPRLWRGAAAVPLFKSGLPSENKSYRLIMVKCQMGLLQEALVFERIVAKVRATVTPGQSGYCRDVGDAHLLLHELMAEAIGLGKPLWVVFGDLEKAFPRTWRQLMLHELSKSAGIRDGMLALLGSMLEHDQVHVHISGNSIVIVLQGVSEGGLIGPLAFPTFMDTLTKQLVDQGCGVGLGIQMPIAWQGFAWSGKGTPDSQVTKELAVALRAGSALPSPGDLAASACLEASALEALDATARFRFAAILHADDPVVLASSLGAAGKAQQIVADWSYRVKAYPHQSPKKSVVMVCGHAELEESVALMPPLVLPLYGKIPVALSHVQVHKWLGLDWSSVLDLSVAMERVLRCAMGKFVSIAGLCTSGILPICYILQIFESCVEGVMRFGRWLYATAEGAEERLDSTYQSWALVLMSAEPWHNWAVAFAELGWSMTGMGRAIVDVAMRRCSLHCLPPGDLYGDVFLAGHALPGSTWGKKSLALLNKWGVQDWPAWSGPTSTKEGYKAYVKASVEARCLIVWASKAEGHVVPVPYLDINRTIRGDFLQALRMGLQWHSLVLQRSLAHLRAGYICFTHLQNKQSSARRQRCIYCGEPTLSPTFHVLCRCTLWVALREATWENAGEVMPEAQAEQVKHLFRLHPEDHAYGCLLAWAGSLERDAKVFWASR
jgi:hypothetical protein